MSAYLGNVNLVSLLPSALALLSLGIGIPATLRRRDGRPENSGQRVIRVFLLLAIGTTMAGYLWFLIMFPDIGKGDTIKATYVLHVFPLVAVSVGVVLEHIEERSQLLYRLLLGVLSIVFLHNLPAMVTHY
jgi:hypothetical protein